MKSGIVLSVEMKQKITIIKTLQIKEKWMTYKNNQSNSNLLKLTTRYCVVIVIQISVEVLHLLSAKSKGAQ